MMYTFLQDNRSELITRCAEKVLRRARPGTIRVTAEQISKGIPLFLDQLTRTLLAESRNAGDDSLQISGASGGDGARLSEIGIGAAAHGMNLLDSGYTVDQVVHNYGDLCQAITDLAGEQDGAFSIDEFRTLNRCLDNAIADAVTGFSSQRDVSIASGRLVAANERRSALLHAFHNALATANYAVNALEVGNLSVSGATGSVLKRSLAALEKVAVNFEAEA